MSTLMNLLKQGNAYQDQVTAELRSLLIDRMLQAVILIAIPGLISTLLRMQVVGLSIYTISSMFGLLAISMIGLVRTHLSYSLRASTLVTALFSLSLLEFLVWGLSGLAIAWLLLGVFGAVVFFNQRTAFLVISGAVLVMLMIAFAVQTDNYRFQMDFNEVNYSVAIWLAHWIKMIIMSASVMFSLNFILSYLTEKIRELSDKQLMLEQTAEKLQNEMVQHRQTSKELSVALENSRKIDEMKDNFLSSVSHELRTPMANLKLYLQLSQKRPEKSGDYMLTMGKEMHRLEGIVEQMLFMAKLHDETEFGTWVRLDLQNIINDIVDEYQEIAIGRRLTLCYYPIENMPALFGSGEMIRQMIRVLVDNAIKYSPAGNRVDIRPLHRSENGLLQIGFRITNTGVRIPQHERGQIFERFYRGQASIDQQVPGAGLGLSTAREIAHMHQGSIYLEDVTSEQVSITILLPGIALTENRHSA